MKSLSMRLAIMGACLLGATALAAPASADPLADLQSFTLKDVKAAEAVYAANPSVPTYQAAETCLGWIDGALSAPGAPVSLGNYVVPQGVASTVADLDVALSQANTGLSPLVLAFNANCGGYVEDLKAEAAFHAAPTLAIAGLKIIP